MAEVARDDGQNDAVKKLAASIVTSQTTEVATMRDLLAERDAKPLAD